MEPVHVYDEVHVISDLHFGGTPKGRQIFDLGPALGRLIDDLAQKPRDTPVALVINGDFVDFLAEPNATYFDPDGAVAKLDRIVEDVSFQPVFQALTRFAKTPGRHLAITLGNHDIELALPWVREHLIRRLSDGSEDAGGRIITAFDGTGFLCTVGDKKVLCVHGNEVDDWNRNDYEALRRKGRDMTFGKPAEQWIPNGGSQMVIEVMNGIKANYPFVDLLKPETDAVIPALLALDPGSATKIAAAIPAGLRRIRDRARAAVGWLGENDAEGTTRSSQQLVDPLDALNEILQRSAGKETGDLTTDELLENAERRLARGEDPFDLAGRDDQKLGRGRAALKALFGRPTKEVLREALQGLRKDRTFDIKEEDDTFKRLEKLIDPSVDVVVTGHTHLERALRRSAGGAYFNSGTWVRLIELTDEVLEDEQRFNAVYDALNDGSMEALDTANGVVQRRPAVVSIWREKEGVQAELNRVGIAPSDPVFQPVKGSRYPKELRRE